MISPGALSHWHPVILSKDLGDKPQPAKVLGHELVVFRTSSGLAALDDKCPHRSARLSAGHVEDGCVVCPYHLWKFAPDGSGKSPANPRMKPFTRSWDVAEHHGIIWVRPQGSTKPLPRIDPIGLNLVGHDKGVIYANYQLVFDNFTEIEHSPTNHSVFAFDAKGVTKVEPQVEINDDHLHITYTGPQRKVPLWSGAWIFGLREGRQHTIDFRVGFSPLQWCYDLIWDDPATGKRYPERVREYAFITPRDEQSTSVFLLFFSSVNLFHPLSPVRKLVAPVFLYLADREFKLDKRICENVESTSPRLDLDGMQLGKFDRVLRNSRKLIASLYEGKTARDEKPAQPEALVQ
jgi:phenylpropionate dioxygenase-like ring-hydroxylating dioxygenase large terminal subunit